MGCIIQVPVSVKKAALVLQLAEKRCSRIGSQDMKRRALQSVLLDPFRSSFKNIGAVGVKAEDKAPVDLNSVIVQDAYAPRVIIGTWAFFACPVEICRAQCF